MAIIFIILNSGSFGMLQLGYNESGSMPRNPKVQNALVCPYLNFFTDAGTIDRLPFCTNLAPDGGYDGLQGQVTPGGPATAARASP